jgi:Protein of unknown function (DUF2865)
VTPRHRERNWQAAVLAGALVLTAAAPGPAQAGFFDFLFGGPERGPTPSVSSYAEPSAPVAPMPLGPESVRGSGSGTGHGVAYCVRLCDGQHFPLERMANATPVEICRAMCPAAQTKVYFGSEIGGAAAKDGTRYADLNTAFMYRKQLVSNCTCNGKNALGLVPLDVSTDPTLRPGDIVATKDGLMAFNGKSAKGDAYTPVNPASVSAQLNSIASRVPLSQKNDVAAADDPGTIAMPQAPPPPVNLGANMRGPISR